MTTRVGGAKTALRRLSNAGSAYLWVLAIERIVCLIIILILLAVFAGQVAPLLTGLRSLL